MNLRERQITISKLDPNESEMEARLRGWIHREGGPSGEGSRIAGLELPIDAPGV